MDSPRNESHVRIAIVGSGFGGIGASIRLLGEGFEDFAIFERADEIGGVWRDNVYPGCACDVPSNVYSFSFAPNPDWTSTFSSRWDIQRYLLRCVETFRLRPHIRFGHDVCEARWDDARGRWALDTSRGDFTADVLIAAPGAFSEPALPDLPGLDAFRGTRIHSARWDPAFDPTGLRVAVVGTGASSVQIVPEIQPKVSRLYVFQRTAAWVLPRGARPVPPWRRRIYRAFPLLQRLSRVALHGSRELMVLAFRNPSLMRLIQRLVLRFLRREIPDPALREKLTPRFVLGCKRILISDDYLRSLARDNVQLITSPIREVRERSLITADGSEHDVDALIFGTGFHITDMPFAERIRGSAGRTLAEIWNGSPKAHLGTTVWGFPNFFLLQGPNTGLGHNSVLIMIEAQLEHVVRALRYMARVGATAIQPRADAQAAFVAGVDARMRGTVWVAGGCRSWYIDRTGRNSTLWPGSALAFRRRVARFDPREYEQRGGTRSAQQQRTSVTGTRTARRRATDS